MARPIDKATQSLYANLLEKTGRPIEQWTAIAARCGRETPEAITEWLKAEHGIGHAFASAIAQKLGDERRGGRRSDEDLVAAQFAGAREPLREIYDALVSAVQCLGNDVEIAPKKSCVSVRRAKQFALIQASTDTCLELGINLKGEAADGRLETATNLGGLVTHRVRLESAQDVDRQLVGWLKQAYQTA